LQKEDKDVQKVTIALLVALLQLLVQQVNIVLMMGSQNQQALAKQVIYVLGELSLKTPSQERLVIYVLLDITVPKEQQQQLLVQLEHLETQLEELH